MFQIRIHGRGGQGVVSAAEILSVAAFLEGKYAQAFPSFGSERTGAPVMSFCRVDDKPIRLREPVLYPDALIIQDPTLLLLPGLFEGLAPGGFALINSSDEQNPPALARAGCPPEHRVAIGATELALKYVGRPLPNAALLGGFAALTGILRLESVLAAIREKFSAKVGAANAAAAQAAWDMVQEARMGAHASAN
ncbi:MAG: 2-oxoacid:acceptor oxidoreductase family protein [Bryobacteraceae bacterium]|jgi:pyruvate ferredoxin oxidoreductase gamma subunit